MLQELVMDKKQSSARSSQTQLKGFTGVEGKKGQDVTSKPWPRGGGKRREPSGGSFSTKNEPSRKPTPQRNKVLVDKRPKPRSAVYAGGSLVGGDEGSRLTVDGAELGSVFVQGSKKQSLNHLLNFHFTRQLNDNSYDAPSNSYRSVAQYRMLNGFKHKYNKEEFLQATCQFVVNAGGNYEINMKDPDALVKWDLIEQIQIQGSEFPSCPICLYPPIAAKMTRCGHIYCWSCILHYLALSDKTWRKCPICFEAIHKQDLKSAVAKSYVDKNVGSKITMRLMKRERGSLISIPVDESEFWNHKTLLNLSESRVNTGFSKLLLANKHEIVSIIERERTELGILLAEDENCPEKCFIDQAFELLALREKNILEEKDNTLSNTRLKHSTSCVDETKDSSLSKHFYFYQASDGQHIYLHPLNIRILERVYGSLENCPTIVEGEIVEKESGSITDELRKRMRYLQHLPVTCQFEIAELDIQIPNIPDEVLSYFKDQIEHRRQRRHKRAREERRHEKRIIEKENRLMGKYAIPNIHIDSYHQFPNFVSSPESPSALLSSSFTTSLHEAASLSASPISDDLSEIVNDMQLNDNNKPNGPSAGPSFATMLSKTKFERSSWPALKTNQPSREPPPKLISVTGKPCRIGFDVKHQQDDSDTEQLDGYAHAPSYSKSFSEDIALALELSAEQVCSDEKPTPTANSDITNSKKKKKPNRKLLFATTMACTGK